MITVYGHVPAWGIPDLSPFVTSIDLYLRMAGLPYQLVVGDLSTAPKGKLPYIEDGAAVVADTSFILEHLKRHYGNPLDGRLEPRHEAVRLMLWRMMNESFYWYLIQARYRRDEDFALYDPLWELFYGHLDADQKRLAVNATRERILAQFYQSGRGRLSWDEVEQMGCREIDALCAWLGEQDYLFGGAPTSADCAVYAFVQGLIYVPFENGIKTYALAQPRLSAYMARVSQRYYPELLEAQREYTHA